MPTESDQSLFDARGIWSVDMAVQIPRISISSIRIFFIGGALKAILGELRERQGWCFVPASLHV